MMHMAASDRINLSEKSDLNTWVACTNSPTLRLETDLSRSLA